MDGRRFDEIARSFAAHASRRAVVKTLAAGIAGGLATIVRRRPASAAPGDPCQSDRDCGNLTCCEGFCRDLFSDRNHCGSCDFGCQGDAACCRGACKDTKTDRNHCGGCGQVCARGDVCLGGMCCQEGSKLINGECCPPAGICGDVCCAAGEACVIAPGGTPRCCPPRRICGQVCCSVRQECVGNACCPVSRICNTPAGPVVCCAEGEVCVQGSCRRQTAAVAGDGETFAFLDGGLLVQAHEVADAAQFEGRRFLSAGSLGLERDEAVQVRDLGFQEALFLKLTLLNLPATPIGVITALALFPDPAAALNAWSWYVARTQDEAQRRDTVGRFADLFHDLSFLPSHGIGMLPAADYTRLLFPYGNLLVAAWVWGDDPAKALMLGETMLDRLARNRANALALSLSLIHLTGRYVDPFLIETIYLLNGEWQLLAGDTPDEFRRRQDENTTQTDWIRSQQRLLIAAALVEYALVDEKRRFETPEDAADWFDEIESRLEATFGVVLGLSLFAITEAAVLAKPDGPADAVKAFLIDLRFGLGGINAGILIYALLGNIVATINLRGFYQGQPEASTIRGTTEPVEDPSVTEFFAWLFREGGLPLALFAISIVRQELNLLEAVIDGDDDARKELKRRIRVNREDVYLP